MDVGPKQAKVLCLCVLKPPKSALKPSLGDNYFGNMNVIYERIHEMKPQNNP